MFNSEKAKKRKEIYEQIQNIQLITGDLKRSYSNIGLVYTTKYQNSGNPDFDRITSKAIKQIKKIAIENNVDAIINLRIQPSYGLNIAGYENGYITIYGDMIKYID